MVSSTVGRRNSGMPNVDNGVIQFYSRKTDEFSAGQWVASFLFEAVYRLSEMVILNDQVLGYRYTSSIFLMSL